MLILENIDLASPLVLAPMAGYTDAPFRRIARRHGAALVFSELVSAEGIVRRDRKTAGYTRFTDDERPLGIQLFGMEPAVMGEAARIVSELGPDIIDINMGCCAPKVCHNGSGASLLRDPALTGRIAAAVVAGASVPVSAKIRLGWDAESRTYRELVRILEDAGVRMITVHGRTASQRFGGIADWDAIREIRENASVPVIGNGDIATHAQALERHAASGCAAVMIGRAAVGNPWIFSGGSPSVGDIVAQIMEHLDAMIDWYGEYGIILMRKHIVKYVHHVKNASKLRNELVHATRRDEIISILARISDDG